MQKIIYVINPETRELLGTADAPLDPVNTARAGKPVFAEVNTTNATDIKPPEHDSDADDLRWLGDKHGWEINKGAKAKRKEDEAVADKEAVKKDKAEQRAKQLEAMTDTERKLFALREDDPAEFEAFEALEAKQTKQAREEKARSRLEQFEKHRENSKDKAENKPKELPDKEDTANVASDNSNAKK